MNLHHRRIMPLMESGLRIFEMDKTANPVALARSWLIHDEGEAHHQPHCRQEQQRRPLVVRYAS
jgi:hypothetical protein